MTRAAPGTNRPEPTRCSATTTTTTAATVAARPAEAVSEPVAAAAETAPSETPEEAASLGDEIRRKEFHIILDTLRRERGRRNRAAEQLGISPRTLRYKLAQMREAGIDLDAELAEAS